MALTSPYLDSPIVAARASQSISREDILARFPGRQVIDLIGIENEVEFPDGSN